MAAISNVLKSVVAIEGVDLRIRLAGSSNYRALDNMAHPANMFYVTVKADWESRLATAKAENRVTIVDFFAQWCGPCKVIASIYESLARDTPNIYFLKVDVDAPEMTIITEACGITAMPTFQVFVNGVKVDDLVGASQDKLKALVAKYAGAAPAQ